MVHQFQARSNETKLSYHGPVWNSIMPNVIVQDIKDLDWDSYMVWYAFGVRHYVMKCSPTTIEASIKNAKILYRAHQALVFVLFLGGLSFLSLFDPFEMPVIRITRSF
jgi:hypothetical protein